MSLSIELRHAREKLGRAINEARSVGDDMRKFPARRAELQAKFDRAMVDVKYFKREVQRLELEVEVNSPVDAPIFVTSPGEAHRVACDAHRAMLHAWLHTGAQGDAHARAIEAAERHGASAEEVHALLSNDDSLGGFLVTDEFKGEILRAVAGRTVVRSAGARVVPTSGSAATWPTMNEAATNPKQYSTDLNQGDGNWKGEGYVTGGTAPTVQDKPTFGLERIPVHLWQPDAIEVTPELAADAGGNLEAALTSAIAEVRAMDEDVAFLKGNGVGKPEGITVDSRISSVVVGDASTYATPTAGDNGFSYPRIVNIYTDLAAQYRQNATWVMNSDSFGLLLKLEDSQSRPLFPINAEPGTLLTRPMIFTEFLDNASDTANVPLIFGDFETGYIIAERSEMRIQRLVERYAPNVGFLFGARIGGQVVRPSAFRLASVQG